MEFRPSGLAVAPDGALYVSDWVSQSYELHGKGAVWRVRWKDAKPAPRSADPKEALSSPHRPVREAAARSLARDEAGRTFLRQQAATPDVRLRAAVLIALLDAADAKVDLDDFARGDPDEGIRELAVRGLVARGADLPYVPWHRQPTAVRAAALAGLKGPDGVKGLVELLNHPDPYLRHAAVQQLAQLPEVEKLDVRPLRPAQRAGVLLALRARGAPEAVKSIATFLNDDDPDVRLLAAKWVADERLAVFRPQIASALEKPGLDPRGYLALATALGRLDDRPVNEDALAEYFHKRLIDRGSSRAVRIQALRAIPASYAKLRTAELLGLLKEPDEFLRIEVLRTLTERGDRVADAAVRGVVADALQPASVRAQGVVALARRPREHADFLVGLALGEDAILAREALRALVRAELSPAQRARLATAAKDPDGLADRALAGSVRQPRPSANDLDAWLKHLDGPADPEAGRRVFEHPTIGGCAKCHRCDGRGGTAGPDLSLIGRTDRTWLVQSLVRPGAVVAPHYQTWKIDTADGRTRLGLLVRTYLDESEYVDEKGDRFKVRAGDGHESTAVTGSIMPDNLVNELTGQELRDLLAYLASRR
jgi:putative heme-binding domain-containing protein